MNVEEKDRLLAILSEIEKFNISEEVAKHYKDSTEINSIAIGRYPIKEFIHFMDRAIKQLIIELQSENYFFYPIQAQAQPIAGIHIENILNAIKNHLTQNQIQNLPPLLDQLVNWEYYFGIWHLSSHSIHNPEELQLKKKKAEVDLLSKKLELSIETLTNKFSELETAKKQVIDFINLKEQELVQINTNLNKSTTETKQVTQLLAEAQKAASDLNGILAVQKEKLEEIKNELEGDQQYFTEFETQSSILEDKLNKAIETSEQRLIKTKEDIDFIESKREDIMRLTGYAADGALGYKFDARQSIISSNLNIWKWGVPAVTLISIAWVVIVFTCISAHFENYWLNLIVNIFKTFPVFILMGFVFKQYNKERNLQEEYAFKAAVAMTITAYSDMLKDQDSDKNVTRQEMLIKAINEVYNSPKLQSEVKQRLISINTKDLKEVITQLTEVISEAKNVVK
jgi:hypothetical protein